MGSKKSAAAAHEPEWENDDIDLSNQENQDRTLVLRREPMPRKVQLISAGVKEIRCVSCVQIRPIAGAEELGDGWICEECVSAVVKSRRHG